MIHFVFDLDNTLVLHQNHVNYQWMYQDNELTYYLDHCNKKGNCYLYTNGNRNHAEEILTRMKIKDKFHELYNRDNVIYMKPELKSFDVVHSDLSERDKGIKIIYFFDDLLENLESASKFGWYTIWIHPNYHTAKKYPYVNLSFQNIKDALKYLETNLP